MSRTVRRKNAGPQDYKWLFSDWHLRYSYPGVGKEKAKTKTKANYHSDGYRGMSSTPGWWVNEFMTRPQRAKTRALTHKVMALDDLEDAPEFPLAKKPHIYYW